MTENIYTSDREDEYLVNMQHTVIPSWYQREGYIKAMANLIEEELKNFESPEKASHIGIPVIVVSHRYHSSAYMCLRPTCLGLVV